MSCLYCSFYGMSRYNMLSGFSLDKTYRKIEMSYGLSNYRWGCTFDELLYERLFYIANVFFS